MGIKIGDYNIALDTHEQFSNINFISHAHSDHTSGIRKNKPVISSSITRELIEVRSRKKVVPLEYSDNIRLLNAGHILGSSQLHVSSEKSGNSILYSGDYQMQESDVAEKIQIKQADILIIDSTYPDKEVVFDERNEVIDCIQKYVESKLFNGIILFGVFSLGKAQDIIRILNDVHIAPVVDKKISDVNKVYEKAGVKLDYISLYDDEDEFDSMTKGNFVGLTSISDLESVSEGVGSIYNKKVFTAVASGFAKTMDLGTDVQFPLSDHADFKQATEYINACNPKQIYTYGREKEAAIFAKNLASEGYTASPFNQNSISLFL